MSDDLPELIRLMNGTYIDFYDAIEDIGELSAIFNKECYAQMAYREEKFKLLFMRILNKVHKIKIGPTPTIFLLCFIADEFGNTIDEHGNNHKLSAWVNMTYTERDCFFKQRLEYKRYDEENKRLVFHFDAMRHRLPISRYLRMIDDYMFDDCYYVSLEKESDISDRLTFNTFNGFVLDTPDPLKLREDVDIIRYHVHDVLCSGDEESYKYFSCWLANIIQNVTINKTACVLISKEHGTGKSILMTLLKRLLGRYMSFSSSMGNVVKFNETILMGKLLVNLNEVNILDKANHEYMKNLIDTPIISIEQKNKPEYTIKNTCNYILTGNGNLVRIENSTERRFFIMRVSPHKIGDIDYFDQLSRTSTRALYDYLMNIDLTDFNPARIYRTELYKEIAQTNEDYVEAFLKYVSDPEYLEDENNVRSYESVCDYVDNYDFSYTSWENVKIAKVDGKQFIFMKKEHFFRLISKWREENTHHKSKLLLKEMLLDMRKYVCIEQSKQLDFHNGNSHTRSFRGIFIDIANIKF
jgi:hypothetical protein